MNLSEALAKTEKEYRDAIKFNYIAGMETVINQVSWQLTALRKEWRKQYER